MILYSVLYVVSTEVSLYIPGNQEIRSKWLLTYLNCEKLAHQVKKYFCPAFHTLGPYTFVLPDQTLPAHTAPLWELEKHVSSSRKSIYGSIFSHFSIAIVITNWIITLIGLLQQMSYYFKILCINYQCIWIVS